MSAIGPLIRRRRNALGLTLEEVARRAGCRKGYLSMIETGRRPPPSEAILTRLEAALNLDGGQLLEPARWASTPPEVRRQVEAMHHEINRARATAQHLLHGSHNLDTLLATGDLHRLIDQAVPNIDSPLVLRTQIPVINDVAAGYPKNFTDLDYPTRIADEYITCPEEIDAQSFGARVVGNSMEPAYREGDIVVFSPNEPTPSGSDCFVRLEPDHETTFKRIFFEGDQMERVRLQPLNDMYPARTVHREEVAGIYAAVFVMRRVSRVNGGVSADASSMSPC